MAETITENIIEIERTLSAEQKVIEKEVAIEEPIFSFNNRNPQAPIILASLYSIVRYKLTRRGYRCYSIHPRSAKATAYRALKKSKIKTEWKDSGKVPSLNKTGMMMAFKYVTGVEPPDNTKYGKETLADSFWIAKTALDRKRAGVYE
jgi:hypothetical protein